MLMEKHHRIFRAALLRASVLGANDGIVSTASLIAGVSAAQSNYDTIITSGLAGLIAGALAMGGGEYVSVCSQSDTENADLKIEKNALDKNSDEELLELIQIYIDRGLTVDLAREVAIQLTQHDALDAHARDELGISSFNRAEPIQAAVVSTFSFAAGGFFPLIVAMMVPYNQIIVSIIASSIAFLSILGIISAWIGGAPIFRATVRVTLLGAIAIAITTSAGLLFGTIP